VSDSRSERAVTHQHSEHTERALQNRGPCTTWAAAAAAAVSPSTCIMSLASPSTRLPHPRLAAMMPSLFAVSPAVRIRPIAATRIERGEKKST
jgi:hypothetical protein